jgi:hypothetical protein
MDNLFYILHNSNILKHFRVHDVANLEQLNKAYRSDELWKLYAYEYYSPEFWNKANIPVKIIYKQQIKRMTREDYF